MPAKSKNHHLDIARVSASLSTGGKAGALIGAYLGTTPRFEGSKGHVDVVRVSPVDTSYIVEERVKCPKLLRTRDLCYNTSEGGLIGLLGFGFLGGIFLFGSHCGF